MNDDSINASNDDGNVLVSGAGPVGLVTAYYLASLGHKVTLYDPKLVQLQQIDTTNLIQLNTQLQTLKQGDFRYISLNHGSYLLLKSIGIDISAIAYPIKQVYISNAGHFGQCCMKATEQQVPALAYAVHYQSLQTYLYNLCKQTNFKHAMIWHAKTMPNLNTNLLNETDAKTHAINYAFICEGGLFNKTQPNDANFTYIDQHQYAHIALANLQKQDVYSQAEPNHTAWERFTKEGPIALLPCKIDYANQTYNHMVVWCNMQEALPNAHQTNIMQALLGSRVNIKHISWQQSYALGVKLRKQNHAYRTAYLGNALQAIHPVAGQGLNLGLRQAFRVVRAFHQHASLDKNLQNWHNFNPFSLVDKLDQQAILQTTKGMAHGFKYAAISALLGLGLQSIAYSKTLNNSVARLFLYGIRGL